MYYIFKFSPGSKKPLDGSFETIEDARKHIDTEYGIVYFELDPDGHDAADCFAMDGEIYAVERKVGTNART